MFQLFRCTQSPPLPLPATYTGPGFHPLRTPSVVNSVSSNTISDSSNYSEWRMSRSDAEVALDEPWKNDGYPGYCDFIVSSSEYFILRRFNHLNTRVILHLQDEVVRLEEALNKLDLQSKSGAGATEHNGTFRKDTKQGRDEILRRLRPLLKEYNEYVSTYSVLRARSSARESQIEKTRIWLHNHPDAIDKKEIAYINEGHDLIPLVPRTKSWLRQAIDLLGPNVLPYIFFARKKKGRSDDPFLSFASNRGINAVMTVLIVIFGLAVLLGPLWWLNYVHNSTERLKIISGFVVFFAGVLASATVEKPFEVLIGTAGYAAVLMVYVQQNTLQGHFH